MFTTLSQVAEIVKHVPTPDELASWSATQLIQVMFGLLLTGISIAGVWFISQTLKNMKDMNAQNDRMLAEMSARYDKQDERYERQDVRHRERDERTLETMREGLEKIADSIRAIRSNGSNGG